jgi:hypothetical protein
VKFGYADPPYLGAAKLRYGPEAREVNHELLIRHLVDEFDGWALSCSSPSLRILLPLCPDGIRVLAWTKTWVGGRANVSPAYAWEPIIMSRLPRSAARARFPHPFDWCPSPAPTRTGTAGAKPDSFSWWLFACAGLEPEDEFVDLFPGSGAVGRAWESWRGQIPLGRGPRLKQAKPDGVLL